MLALAIGHFSTDLNLLGLPIGESGEEDGLALGASDIMPLGISLARFSVGTAGNFDDLQQVIDDAYPGELKIITLYDDIHAPTDRAVNIHGGRHIRLIGNSRIHIIASCRQLNTPTLNVVDSRLYVGDGVVVTRLSDSYGRGIIAENSYIVLESGSEVSGNGAEGAYYRRGGGVLLTEGSTLIMHPGAYIRDNGLVGAGGTGTPHGGGVYILYDSSASTFNMLGGTISGNVATQGGGVSVGGGTFNMEGGYIIGNTAGQGGGVYNTPFGTFVLNQGRISGNYASADGHLTTAGGGGGVQNLNVFTMYGGEISNNLAYAHGGGIANLGEYSEFIMHDGVISDNTANWGGGLSNYRGYVTMHSGRFEGNTGRYHGGGIYIVSPPLGDGLVHLISGEFRDNGTAGDGGAIWVQWRNPDRANLETLRVDADVDFFGNFARAAFERDPAFDAIYAVQISPDITWTVPFTQGYNNFDISHDSANELETIGFRITYRWVWDYFGPEEGLGRYQDIMRRGNSPDVPVIPNNLNSYPREYEMTDFIDGVLGRVGIPLETPGTMEADGVPIPGLHFRGFTAYFDGNYMTSGPLVLLDKEIPGIVGGELTRGDITIVARFTMDIDRNLPFVNLPAPPTTPPGPGEPPPIELIPPMLIPPAVIPPPPPGPPIPPGPPTSPPIERIPGGGNGDSSRDGPGRDWTAVNYQPETQAPPEETEDTAEQQTPPNANFNPPTGR